MRKQNLLLILASLLSPLTGAYAAPSSTNSGDSFSRADLAGAATLRERAMSDSTAYQLIESLTTEVGPRPAGSEGDRAAVAWAQREMQRLGFANVHTVPTTVPHWVRGEAEFAVLAPWHQNMPTLALGLVMGLFNSSSTVQHNLQIDYAALYYNVSR